MIAAEMCGRTARLIEIDPAYCDTIIARWQTYTGKRATRQSDGRAFDDLPAETIVGDRAPPKRRSRRAVRVT